ncbi:MAG: TrkA family potassium uptake protein [Clostridiales bacterium]|jgi:trk system potassium uptake protein TrkA|nr:TrkA family potassium uptake protein [Clostridiales bacterium]
MYIIVIGCGRLGSNLARNLSDLGHDVCIIDRDGKKLDVLGNGFNGQRIKGIEFDSDNLLEGGIRQADALLAVTSDDNINITVSLVAKTIYHVPRIIARVNDPNRLYIYKMLHLTVINPVQLGVDLLIRRLVPESPDVVLAQDQDYDILELFVDKGKTGTVSKIQQKYSCVISGLIRHGHMRLPQSDDEIYYGDKIICTVCREDRERLAQSFSKEAVLWDPS